MSVKQTKGFTLMCFLQEGSMICRGVRGATTVEENTPEGILAATQELLLAICQANGIDVADIASIIFTTTPDLTAAFPAAAVRTLGWTDVPMLCTHEINVPGALPRCVRVLIHWNTDRPQQDIRHVYLREAVRLRPDWAQRLHGKEGS